MLIHLAIEEIAQTIQMTPKIKQCFLNSVGKGTYPPKDSGIPSDSDIQQLFAGIYSAIDKVLRIQQKTRQPLLSGAQTLEGTQALDTSKHMSSLGAQYKRRNSNAVIKQAPELLISSGGSKKAC